jgi:hypothetical protein
LNNNCGEQRFAGRELRHQKWVDNAAAGLEQFDSAADVNVSSWWNAVVVEVVLAV